jgi:hypothetical protein
MRKTKEQIINQGYDAFWNKELREDNPWFEDCEEFDWWLEGYELAASDPI